jgi:hypothetical protein
MDATVASRSETAADGSPSVDGDVSFSVLRGVAVDAQPAARTRDTTQPIFTLASLESIRPGGVAVEPRPSTFGTRAGSSNVPTIRRVIDVTPKFDESAPRPF